MVHGQTSLSRKYGFTEADWKQIKAEIRTILIGLARIQSTITYSELAAQIRTAYVHFRAPAFHRILQELCADEIAEGRPILGVVVVNKQTGRCGAGYFKWAAARGYNVADPEAFWQSEYENVCDYWSNVETE